jgi:hypothetical protein
MTLGLRNLKLQSCGTHPGPHGEVPHVSNSAPIEEQSWQIDSTISGESAWWNPTKSTGWTMKVCLPCICSSSSRNLQTIFPPPYVICNWNWWSSTNSLWPMMSLLHYRDYTIMRSWGGVVVHVAHPARDPGFKPRCQPGFCGVRPQLFTAYEM